MSIELSHDAIVQVAPPVLPEVHMDIPAVGVVTVPIAGPQGAQGPSGSGSGAYLRHEQSSPASVVTIVHDFGRWPSSITLTSIDGSITFAVFGVEMIDLNTIRISIDQPTAYVALIS